MTTLGTLVLSSRPLSWINTAFPFALAYYVITERVDTALAVGFFFFLIPYNLLMYGINDVFDYESDMRNPRKGGVVRPVTPRATPRHLDHQRPSAHPVSDPPLCGGFF